MKLQLSRRELIIIVFSVLIVLGLGAYSYNLHNDLATEKRINESNNALLRAKDAEANETANYIDTICAEYRKLYASDREVRYPNQTNVDKYIGLPGSAKGQIDKCYLPD